MRRLLGGLLHRLFPAYARARANALILARGHGHARSVREGRPVDAEGRPLPWYTYPAIEYLSQLDWSGALVFEFGAGYSSLFWARRAAGVVAVENDPAWHARIEEAATPNLTLRLRTERDAYLACLGESGSRFDLIVIDGRWRRECARLAPARLADGGLIVLDNADWYPRTTRELRDAGFWQVDFSGFGPMHDFTWTTSVFFGADRRRQLRRAEPAPIGGIRQRAADD